MSYVKIGVAGPVGSGKTALIESLTRKMAGDYSIGVITNDIYTKELSLIHISPFGESIPFSAAFSIAASRLSGTASPLVKSLQP